MTRPRADERGQSTVELVALLPLVLVVGLAALAALAAHAAGGQAAAAAQAGAMALIRGGEPRAAARAALPRGVRARARVRVAGRRVVVTVRPDLPPRFAAAALAATASAYAGPAGGGS
jgi:hypothetical protein